MLLRLSISTSLFSVDSTPICATSSASGSRLAKSPNIKCAVSTTISRLILALPTALLTIM